MSQADQQRWNQRYAQGAYSERTHPSEFLRRWLPKLALGANASALDVACGAGRNALFLAASGYRVSAVDGASVAIERGRAAAQAAGLRVQWLVADLDAGVPQSLDSKESGFDLIIMIRYVNLPLLARLQQRLKPGGYLLVEQHLQTDMLVGGPQRAAFRVPRNALQEATQDLCCVAAEQGLFADPDGKPMALSRLLARRQN
ncbi:MAG: class I SAM-dependent methyltransferase [Pseudomonadales bacterium]